MAVQRFMTAFSGHCAKKRRKKYVISPKIIIFAKNLMKRQFSILYLKHSFLGLMMAVVWVITCHLTVAGENIDSLYHVFLKADASQRVDVVNTVSRSLYNDGITDSLYQCDKSSGRVIVETMMHYLMTEHYYDCGQYENALNEGIQARDMMNKKKPSKFQSDVMGVLSSTQYRIGDYDEALKTLLDAYDMDRKLNDQELISSDLHNMAAIYLAVEQPAQGIKYIEKAVSIERELNRTDRLGNRLGMACELYLVNKEYDKAIDAIDEAYAIDKKEGRADRAAIRLVQKCSVLERLDKLDEALHLLEQAVPVLEGKDITYSLAVAYNLLGSINQKKGNAQKAIDYYKKGLEQSIKCGSPRVERVAERGLWESMRDTNPKVALLHLERYSELNDSMTLEMAATRIKVMEATNRNNEQTELDNKTKFVYQLLKWGGFIIVAMLVALIVSLFYSQRKMKNALSMQHQTQEIRQHFSTNITNELQSPLSVVMGAGQLLTEGKSSADETKQLGQVIVSHVKNMFELVNQLLDIEKLRFSADSPNQKRGDIVMFVRMLVDNFNDKAQQKLLNLEFNAPVKSLMVSFVPEYIRKIVHSLVDNAIKFTPSKGSVTVSLTMPVDGRMKLIVSDTGKGIPVEERDRLFEPLIQSDNDDDGVGTSLGLSLAYQLVQAINGTISVDSELGRGSTFTVEFPVQKDEGQDEIVADSMFDAEKYISKSKDKEHKPLVFIVENNEDVAFFIARLLSKDYNLRFARDGREALQTAQDMVPDLIITNMKMPVMDGRQLMEQVRGNTILNHIPIIAMTTSTSVQERMDCIRAGADAVLVKPFNSDELRLLTSQLIKLRSLMRERYVKSGPAVTPADSGTKKMSKEDKEFINRLIDVIHAHMAKEDVTIDIDNIAAALTLSRKQLRSRITAITGMTAVAFVLQVRLNYAQRLITTDDAPLTTIAKRCGFQTLSHFSKAFKQQFGVSPQQFRKNLDSSNLITNPRISSS